MATTVVELWESVPKPKRLLVIISHYKSFFEPMTDLSNVMKEMLLYAVLQKKSKKIYKKHCVICYDKKKHTHTHKHKHTHTQTLNGKKKKWMNEWSHPLLQKMYCNWIGG